MRIARALPCATLRSILPGQDAFKLPTAAGIIMLSPWLGSNDGMVAFGVTAAGAAVNGCIFWQRILRMPRLHSSSARFNPKCVWLINAAASAVVI